MRPNQHSNKQRSRGRGRRQQHGGSGGGGGGGGNPANRVYESNGPDIKVRGTAQTVADKYLQLGRDAHSSGDNVMAESYYQHAEHYLRIVAAAQAYQQQLQQQYRPDGGDGDDENDGDGEEDGDGDETPQAASVERREYPPQRPPETGDQPDVMGFEAQDRGNYQPQPQPQRQEREFRPRNEGRDRARPQRFDRPPRDGNDAQAPRSEQRPPRPPEPALEAAAAPQPRLEEAAAAANGNPFGDSEQPSFLRRGPAGKPRAERRPRRELAEEGAEAPPPMQPDPPPQE